MTDDDSDSDTDDRASRVRAMQHQLEWLEHEAARLEVQGPLIESVLESLRRRIDELRAKE